MKKYQVPTTAITEKGLKRLIRDAAKSHSSLAEWGKEHGVTPQVLSAFFRKTQGAGLKLPEVLGYRPQTVYLLLDEELITSPTAPRRATSRPTSKVDHSKAPIEKNKTKKRDDREETKAKLKKRNRL